MIGETSHSLVIRASCVDNSDPHGVPTVHDAFRVGEECLKKRQGWPCCSATRAGRDRVYWRSPVPHAWMWSSSLVKCAGLRQSNLSTLHLEG